MSDLDFTGKTALVVGGSSGIGNGIAQAYRARGADVHVWGTRAGAADYQREEGSDLTGLTYSRVDVSDMDAIESHQPTFTSLDILVLCQGTVAYKRAEFQREGWDRVMAVNLDSLRACAMKFHDLLEKSRGSLIIVSSVAGFRANKGNPAYSASKYGAVGLTASLGEAWAPAGIRVNGIAPGFVDTKLTKVTTEHPKRREMALASIPSGRFGTPADMAGAALFLASPLADYMCGQTLIVDGGLSLS
ncbi:MAG: SDR family oxidoreductase [Ectothiorhodospiraceae bacterium]|nr:SDR family oxidoreductase [Ectothiorhodospiraceae bacterium]MCH8503290.1 SDR family oxidoreductase [Ectothiorhodospiraceae bacterium]